MTTISGVSPFLIPDDGDVIGLLARLIDDGMEPAEAAAGVGAKPTKEGWRRVDERLTSMRASRRLHAAILC